MTAEELKSARQALGLSVERLATVLEVEGRTVRRWEDGSRSIPGPVRVLVLLLQRSPVVRKLLGVG